MMGRKDIAKKRRLAKIRARHLKDKGEPPSEATPRKNIPDTSQGPQEQYRPSRVKTLLLWLKLLSPIGKLVAFFCMFLTFVGSYYTFSTKLSISYSNPINQMDLRSMTFIVRNNSLFPVTDINFEWHAKRVTSAETGGTVMDVQFSDSSIPPIPHLEAGEATTFFLPFPINIGPISYADIVVSVTYHSIFLPFNKQKSVRFTGQIRNNQVIWRERSLSEK